jgi:hypothetical protein
VRPGIDFNWTTWSWLVNYLYVTYITKSDNRTTAISSFSLVKMLHIRAESILFLSWETLPQCSWAPGFVDANADHSCIRRNNCDSFWELAKKCHQDVHAMMHIDVHFVFSIKCKGYINLLHNFNWIIFHASTSQPSLVLTYVKSPSSVSNRY